MGLAHLLYSCLPCLLFNISFESPLDLVQPTAVPHPPYRNTLLIIFLSLFPFRQYWWIHDLPVLDHDPKTYSFLFSPFATSASVWLEYSVLSRVMTSSVTHVLLTYTDVLRVLWQLSSGSSELLSATIVSANAKIQLKPGANILLPTVLSCPAPTPKKVIKTCRNRPFCMRK